MLAGGDRQLAGGARADRRGRARSRPWNYPLHQIAAKVAPALAVGCTVVLKPSEVAPLNAFILAEIIDGGGRSRRRVQPRHRHRPGGGRGDRLAPGRRHGVLHRLDPRGPAGERAGRAEREARGARAGRQVAERDPRRRRPRDGGHGRRREVLLQLRPDVQRADAHARAARAPRGGGAASPAPVADAFTVGDPFGEEHAARPAGVRRPARARARLHPQGRRGGRQARDRRRRKRPTAWTAATSCGRRSSPTCATT